MARPGKGIYIDSSLQDSYSFWGLLFCPFPEGERKERKRHENQLLKITFLIKTREAGFRFFAKRKNHVLHNSFHFFRIVLPLLCFIIFKKLNLKPAKRVFIFSQSEKITFDSKNKQCVTSFLNLSPR